MKNLFLPLLCSLIGILSLGAQSNKRVTNLTTALNISSPRGIEVDNSYLWISHDYQALNANGVLAKITRSNSRYLGYIPIGNGFLDVESSGYVKQYPGSSNILWVLLPDGRLLEVNKTNNSRRLILNLRAINFSSVKCYDVHTGTVRNFSGLVNTAYSTFGDFDFFQNTDGSIDVFISGLSQAQTFPFLMKMRIKSGKIIQSLVLASSLANGTAGNVTVVRLTRGVAVSKKYKRVITTLNFSKGIGNLFDALVSFPINFDPTNGITSSEIPVINKSVDVSSLGMTVSSDGTILVSSTSVGSVALNSAGQPFIGAFNNNLQLMSGIKLNSIVENLRDVVLDGSGKTGYITSTSNTVYRFSLTSNASTIKNNVEEIEVIGIKSLTDIQAISSQGFNVLPSIEEISNTILVNSITAWPNPFSTEFNVKFHLDTPSQLNIYLYDIAGKPLKNLGIYSYDSGEHIQRFENEVNDLPNGIYFIKIFNEGKLVKDPIKVVKH